MADEQCNEQDDKRKELEVAEIMCGIQQKLVKRRFRGIFGELIIIYE